jgi:ribonuclease-3
LSDLAARLGLPPSTADDLAQAMAHRSWCAENPGVASNERLEFLGDAVLGLVITDHLFGAYPDMPEGELAKVRASVVNSEALAELATSVSLGASLWLGKGEDASGGREKPSILADAMEAVIGAVYLALGWAGASELIMRIMGERIEDAAAGPGGQDFKTRLQELAAREFDQLPRYEVTDTGPDHAKSFSATVNVGGVRRGQGVGRSKKQAEQAAAREAWHALSLLVSPPEDATQDAASQDATQDAASQDASEDAGAS